jgi:hypothetical protein
MREIVLKRRGGIGGVRMGDDWEIRLLNGPRR